MVEKTIKTSIDVAAPVSKVWEALTNPALTPKYMYGCEAISDWKIGSPLIWKSVTDGIVYVTGNVKVFEPNRRLDYTVFDPNSTMEDIPENHLTMTFELSENNGNAHVDISMGDFSTVANGEARYEDSIKGGDGVWQVFKAVVEEGK